MCSKGRMWKYFVKEEGCGAVYENDTLTGSEARSIYESVLKSTGITKRSRPLTSESCNDSTKQFKIISVAPFNINAFLAAAQNNNTAVLENILGAHPEMIDCTDAYGWSALMCASQGGCLGAVKFLIRTGADLRKVDRNGRNAFNIATNAGHTHIANILRMGVISNSCNTSENNVNIPMPGFCELCNESAEDIRSHVLSIVHNFNKQKGLPTCHYNMADANRGYKLMLKTGWRQDQGLGPSGRGTKFPVKTCLKMDKKGFGLEKLRPRVTHFKPYDELAVKNVLPINNKYQKKQNIHRKKMLDKRKEIKFRMEFS